MESAQSADSHEGAKRPSPAVTSSRLTHPLPTTRRQNRSSCYCCCSTTRQIRLTR